MPVRVVTAIASNVRGERLLCRGTTAIMNRLRDGCNVHNPRCRVREMESTRDFREPSCLPTPPRAIFRIDERVDAVPRRPLHKIAADKSREIAAFWRHSRTPLRLTLDTLRLESAPFVAVTSDSIKVELRPGAGESFTLYENLIRRDYLAYGICLGPGATVVDIGANLGTFTVLAASIVGPAGRVIAFEPESATFARLQANVALNGRTTSSPARRRLKARLERSRSGSVPSRRCPRPMARAIPANMLWSRRRPACRSAASSTGTASIAFSC